MVVNDFVMQAKGRNSSTALPSHGQFSVSFPFSSWRIKEKDELCCWGEDAEESKSPSNLKTQETESHLSGKVFDI